MKSKKELLNEVSELLIKRNKLKKGISEISLGLIADMRDLDVALGSITELEKLIAKWGDKKFRIMITEKETRQALILVTASSSAEAIQIVTEKYDDGEYEDDLYAEYCPDYTIEEE